MWNFLRENNGFLLYLLLFEFSTLINKYILSVLNFTYPTILQGWQTLVGAILLSILRLCTHSSVGSSELDGPGFISLFPTFPLFTASIVASSKALAELSIPVFLCMQNTLTAALCLLQMAKSFSEEFEITNFSASLLTIGSAVLVVLSESEMTFSESPYFWMIIGLFCTAIHKIYAKSIDVRYTLGDRLYYCYIFSVFMLAPASFYLEEAFNVLKFPDATRYDFLLCCFLSGISALLLNLVTIKVQASNQFPTVDALARLIICGTSITVFIDTTKNGQKFFILANLAAAAFVRMPIPKGADGINREVAEDETTLLS